MVTSVNITFLPEVIKVMVIIIVNPVYEILPDPNFDGIQVRRSHISGKNFIKIYL